MVNTSTILVHGFCATLPFALCRACITGMPTIRPSRAGSACFCHRIIVAALEPLTSTGKPTHIDLYKSGVARPEPISIYINLGRPDPEPISIYINLGWPDPEPISIYINPGWPDPETHIDLYKSWVARPRTHVDLYNSRVARPRTQTIYVGCAFPGTTTLQPIYRHYPSRLFTGPPFQGCSHLQSQKVCALPKVSGCRV